ncbi:MAG TPA: hypothetical protein VMT43_07460 [Acidimicrobiales bacterium]|nr:hypothetical protein [Acidimicrobiales bacterium]
MSRVLADVPSTDFFAVDLPRGLATCGYCHETFGWPGEVGASMAKGYLTLTGYVALALDEAGALVVVFEVTAGGAETWLPHPCPSIPADVAAEARAEVAR